MMWELKGNTDAGPYYCPFVFVVSRFKMEECVSRQIRKSGRDALDSRTQARMESTDSTREIEGMKQVCIYE